MSQLTFDFPNWQAGWTQERDHAKNPRDEAAQDWAADLADLDEVDDSGDERAVASRAEQGPDTSPNEHVRGDAIPAEVLLLVLSDLGVSDCMRAALVCQHWYTVVLLSNDLWLGLSAREFAGGTWHRAPHVGRALLRPPPGGGHACSRLLDFKTTCVLTQVSCRLPGSKGFQFVLEAASSLWLAVCRAASGQDQQLAAAESECAAKEPAVSPSAGGSSPSCSTPADKRRRITHVDQLWDQQGRNRSALQVDERFNGVRVHEVVSKLTTAHWQHLYDALAAVMTSRCDELRDELAAQLATSVGSRLWQPSSLPSSSQDVPPQPKEAENGGVAVACSAAAAASGGSAVASSRTDALLHGGELVYGGTSYADQFAELIRNGDTRGALALGAKERASAHHQDGSCPGAGNGPEGVELEEPEMRQVVLPPGTPGACEGALLSQVEEGLVLWQQLLAAWARYRRWLDVLCVWCGSLGARVEAERQLAGAAVAHGDVPLAPPHLAHRGLQLFRSQVVLSYPLRRSLQAAALWLSARVSEDDAANAFGASSQVLGLAGGNSDTRGSVEHARLLRAVRKVLTELAVPDDATAAPQAQTRHKLARCFGRLLPRSEPTGNSRVLAAAQRMAVARAGEGGFGGNGGRSMR